MKACCDITEFATRQRRVLQIVLWITVGVLLAAAGVGATGLAWPDIAIGLLIAAMFGGSSIGVIRAASHQLRVSAVS